MLLGAALAWVLFQLQFGLGQNLQGLVLPQWLELLGDVLEVGRAGQSARDGTDGSTLAVLLELVPGGEDQTTALTGRGQPGLHEGAQAGLQGSTVVEHGREHLVGDGPGQRVLVGLPRALVGLAQQVGVHLAHLDERSHEVVAAVEVGGCDLALELAAVAQPALRLDALEAPLGDELQLSRIGVAVAEQAGHVYRHTLALHVEQDGHQLTLSVERVEHLQLLQLGHQELVELLSPDHVAVCIGTHDVTGCAADVGTGILRLAGDDVVGDEPLTHSVALFGRHVEQRFR